jgi:hypothetical protein
MISMPSVSNSLPLAAANGISSSESGAQSTEENKEPGQFITVEDPEHGYKYIYIVIGKHFKQLISCEPMESNKNDKSGKNTDNGEKQQSKGQTNAVKDNPYIGTMQSFLAQQNQKKPYLRENLLEKIRIWEQCSLLDKPASKKFEAKG